MPKVKNTSGKQLEIEVDGKKVMLKPGESITIPEHFSIKAEGDFEIS